MTVSPFEPKGRVALREAARAMIENIAPDEGITYAEAIELLSESTGEQWEKASVLAAVLAASEALIRDGQPGMETVRRYGWVRMTPDRLLKHAERRNRRGTRQFRRSARAAEATPPESLSWQDRQKRDRFIISVGLEAELFGRRANRRRPLPPGEETT